MASLASATNASMLFRPLAAASGLLARAGTYEALSGFSAGARFMSSKADGADSLFVSDISLGANRTPLLLSLASQLASKGKVGFFQPIAGQADRSVDLLAKKLSGDVSKMTGVPEAEAVQLIAEGKQAELMDRIYSAYADYKKGHDLVLVEGAGHRLGNTEIDAQIAFTLGSPVLMAMKAAGAKGCEAAKAALLKRAIFANAKVDVLGLAVQDVSSEADLAKLRENAGKSGLAVVDADVNLDLKAVEEGLQKPRSKAMTPIKFAHGINSMCLANPQHVVLPESADKRVLAAAAELVQRKLAKITILGDPATVAAEAQKLGLDMTGVNIVKPEDSPRLGHYVDILVEARKSKGMTPEKAKELLLADINFFGTLMITAGDCDGMVSGAMHTTAATIRPALQLLKFPDGTLVSSIFFMCLQDRVLVYADCAVNVNPTSEDLASIAICSADTAAAFGIDARVAMCSYSTLGSGAGPDVEKVAAAVKIVREKRPDLKVEGPIQYDAAIDPSIAKTKIKGHNEVAGKATVFVFPDLNTGNNCYKAVQQSTGTVAVGPVMQGLTKPVNDLSRGCTVADIVNTVCATSIQCQQAKARDTKA